MAKEIMLSVCVPCFGRPERTIRLLNQIMEQDMDGWEVFMIGDGCPDFQKLINDGRFDSHIELAKQKGNILTINNLPIHYGGYGYEVRNRVKQLAQGRYIIFVDNDDTISHNHFSHYLSEIVNTRYDFVFYKTHIQPLGYDRIPALEFGRIGHSEIIVSTTFYKLTPNQTPEYGHDWKLIESMIRMGAYHKRADSNIATYFVMGVGEHREQGIN